MCYAVVGLASRGLVAAVSMLAPPAAAMLYAVVGLAYHGLVAATSMLAPPATAAATTTSTMTLV